MTTVSVTFGEVIRVDSSAGTFTSRVLGATNANWVGGEQLRYFEMRDNDYVVLRTPPLAYAGVELVGTLAWAKEKVGCSWADCLTRACSRGEGGVFEGP